MVFSAVRLWFCGFSRVRHIGPSVGHLSDEGKSPALREFWSLAADLGGPSNGAQPKSLSWERSSVLGMSDFEWARVAAAREESRRNQQREEKGSHDYPSASELISVCNTSELFSVYVQCTATEQLLYVHVQPL